MPEPPGRPQEGALSPDDVAHQGFSAAFRGYDQHEVRAFLEQVAAQLRAVLERDRALHRRLEDAESRAAGFHIGEDEITAALGKEAARVLQSARDAAAELQSRAEDEIANLLRKAHDEVAAQRADAERLLAVRTAEADAAADEIRRQAEHAAQAELEKAKAEGRQMVMEAQAVRERILRDLARRRRLAHQQLEKLRAGRERLLEVYRVVRATTEEATRELTVAEGEARAAAEAAALRFSTEPPPTLEELEAEVQTARHAGLPVFDPVFRPSLRIDAPVAEAEAGASEEELADGEDDNAEPAAVEVTVEAVEEPATAEPEEEDETSEVVAEVEAEVDEPAAEEAARPAPSLPGPVPTPDLISERRSSTLRILRRAEAPEPEPVVEPEPEPVGIAELLDEPEEPAVPSVPAARGPSADLSWGDELEGVRVLRPEPSPEPEPEPEPDNDPAVAFEAEPAPEPEPDRPAAAAPSGVDALFARIRADRAAALSKAHAVLGDTEPSAEPGAVALVEREPDGLIDITVGEPGPQPLLDGDEVLLQRRDEAIDPADRAVVRALKRALADEQNEVLDRLRRHRGVPGVDDLLPDPHTHAARYEEAATAPLQLAAEAGARFPERALGGPVGVGDLAAALADEVTVPLRARLSRTLADAQGYDAVDLAETVSSFYREWKSQRLESLARHHVAAAFSRGAFVATPAGTSLRWVVDDDGGPCPDCDDNVLAGGVVKGDAFPTGQTYPPAHAGCRCLLVPSGH